MKIEISKEEKILHNHYRKCYEHVCDNPYFATFADEKYTHSMQVAGVGNYLLKNENIFRNKTPEQIKNAKLAYFFHDIGRFEEIQFLYETEKNNLPQQKYDHGIEGWKILKNMPPYNIDEILLPVKHHGHMIEKLYEDEEYVNISDKDKIEEVKHNIFLARDADKIANFYLLKKMYHDEHYKKMFFGIKPDTAISKQAAEDILNCRIVELKDVVSFADKILAYISWIFDMNYKYSFIYCKKLKVMDFFLKILDEHNQDKLLQEKIEKTINNYMNDWLNN